MKYFIKVKRVINYLIKSSWISRFFRSFRFRKVNHQFSLENQLEYSQRKKRRIPSVIFSEYGVKNIFLIVIDCLRGDYLNWGNNSKDSSFLNSLAKHSLYSPYHYTTSPWTYPAVLSILFGLYPEHHGGRIESNEIRHFLKKDIPYKYYDDLFSITDIIEKIGYKTHYFSSIITADLAVKGLFENTFCQLKFSAEELFGEVRKTINNHSRYNFFYLQLGDLHVPINIKQRYLKKYQVDSGLEEIENWNFGQRLDRKKKGYNNYKSNRINLYKAALEYVDDQIQSFYSFLEKNKLLEDSLVIITSDHGEEFWDHVKIEGELFEDPRNIEGIGHGHSLFEELVRVPLIISSSKIKPQQLDFTTSHVDIFPTIIDILKLKTDVNSDGMSVMNMDKKMMRPIFLGEIAYGFEQKGRLYYPWKVIACPAKGWKKAYNIQKDPIEQKDVYQSMPKELRQTIMKTMKS